MAISSSFSQSETKRTCRNTFGQLVRDCTSKCALPSCLSWLFISSTCQLRSWGEMRIEVLKNRQYGSGRPSLGDNENDWAHWDLLVFVQGGLGMSYVGECREIKAKMGQFETFSVLNAWKIEKEMRRETEEISWVVDILQLLCLMNTFHTLSYSLWWFVPAFLSINNVYFLLLPV